MDKSVDQNIRAHDRIAELYNARHKEIFNPIEQNRLRKSLERSADFIETTSLPRIALDFGCGTGNLTQYLLDLGFHVIAADVSTRFLKLINEEFAHSDKIKTLKLNGIDLCGIDNEMIDMVATYSVLHHIPDYLSIIREMTRVVKPGGIIYLDHEVQETYWSHSPEYAEYLTRINPPVSSSPPGWRRFLKPATYWRKINRWCSPAYWRLRYCQKSNPRHSDEGDIHVWPDDHIEWGKIKEILVTNGCEILYTEDYLLFKGTYPVDVYREFEHRCHDMRMVVAKRLYKKD